MKKIIKNGLFIVAIVFLCGFICYKNKSNASFFDASLIQLLTFALAALISFFFVQHLTDKRRKIDCIEHILQEIENIINQNNNLFSVNPEALLLQEAVGNRIKYISENGFKEIQDDMNYIEAEFNELRELYGNHKSTDDELNSIREDLSRHKIRISSRCTKVKLRLFNI